MIAKVIFACLCTLLVSGHVQSRTISAYDLQPAEVIMDKTENKVFGLGAIYKDCSAATDKFKLTGVTVQGCTTSPCILKKGTTTDVEIDLIANEATANVTAKVYGEILGQKVPFPITEPDCCKCGITCPTKKAAAYKYKYSLPVSTAYPSLTVPVFWYMYDAQNAESLCMSVLVKIES